MAVFGHINDVMKLGKGTLLFNTREPAALSVKMNWLKNIREQRYCPIQILFRAMDLLVCPLLNLAIWLEEEEHGLLLFGQHRSNRLVASVLDTIFAIKSSLRFGGASFALTPF